MEKEPGEKLEPYEDYDQIEESEQIERFKRIYYLLDPFSTYMDFLANAQRYQNRFKIEGADDPGKVSSLFWRAEKGNEIIRLALEVYLESQQREQEAVSKLHNPSLFLEKKIQDVPMFLDKKSSELDVNRLTEMFRWSLQSFVRGGESLGKSPTISEADIDPLCQDLGAILKHIKRTDHH